MSAPDRTLLGWLVAGLVAATGCDGILPICGPDRTTTTTSVVGGGWFAIDRVDQAVTIGRQYYGERHDVPVDLRPVSTNGPLQHADLTLRLSRPITGPGRNTVEAISGSILLINGSNIDAESLWSLEGWVETVRHQDQGNLRQLEARVYLAARYDANGEIQIRIGKLSMSILEEEESCSL